MVDEDRSELDEREVAVRVLEHAQTIDPTLGAYLVRGDLEGLAKRVDVLRQEAPFRRTIQIVENVSHHLVRIAPRRARHRQRRSTLNGE